MGECAARQMLLVLFTACELILYDAGIIFIYCEGINFVSKVRGMAIPSKLLFQNKFMGVLLVPRPHAGSKQQQCSEFVSLVTYYYYHCSQESGYASHRIYIDLDNVKFAQG